MPLPIPIIAAGISAAGTGVNAYAQGRMNKKMRQFTVQRDQWARNNAMADWNMQNEYNSPQAQMQRFRDAGLNPNLIYGQMGESASVRSTDPGSWNPQAPNVDLGEITGRYFDAQIKTQQVDNMQKQADLMEVERIVRQQQAINIAADTVTKSLNNDYSELSMGDRLSLAKSNAQAGQLALRQAVENIAATQASTEKTRADTQFTLDQNERAWALQSTTIAEAVERILTHRKGRQEADARIKNLNKDGQLKQLDINLKEKGIQPGDPLYMRALIQLLKGSDYEEIYKDLKAGSPAAAPKISNKILEWTIPGYNK